MEQKRKRGRPKKEGSRRIQSHTLFSYEEYKLIRDSSKITGKTMSDLIRVGAIRYASEEVNKCKKSKKEGGNNDFYDYENEENEGFDEKFTN